MNIDSLMTEKQAGDYCNKHRLVIPLPLPCVCGNRTFRYKVRPVEYRYCAICDRKQKKRRKKCVKCGGHTILERSQHKIYAVCNVCKFTRFFYTKSDRWATLTM